MEPTCHVPSGQAVLAAYVAGDGAPVVFLHANVCDSRMWTNQLAGLGAGHMTVAYDRRGFGNTTAMQEDHSPVADLVAMLDAVSGTRPAVLVGCSQGGKIALDAALTHPDRVRGLVLIATSVGGWPEVTLAPTMRRLLDLQQDVEAAGDLDQLTATKARLWLDGPLAPEGRVTGEARRLFIEMHGQALRSPPVGASLDVEPVFNRLGGIAAPALVLWGDLDFPHIQERCSLVASMTPNGSGRELQGCAHLPSLERPDDVTSHVAEFLRRWPG